MEILRQCSGIINNLVWIFELTGAAFIMGSIRRFPRRMQSGGWLIFIGIGLVALRDMLESLFPQTLAAASPYAWPILPTQAIYMLGILLLLLGIVKGMKTTTRLGNSEERFHSLTRVAADAIITIDENNTILSFNQCAENMFGRPAETMIGGKLHVIIPERYRSLHDAGVAGMGRKGGAPFGGQTKEFHALRRDGSEFPIELTVAGWANEVGRRFFIGIIRDITKRKQLEDDLRRMATTDAMTGIYNRRHFLELMIQEMHRAHRMLRPLALIMLDIDLFKRVNDSYGHAIGDEVIKSLTRACTSELREIDIFGRIGGEEFAILLPELRHEQGLEVAERLRRKIETLVIEANDKAIIHFTASMGVAVLEEDDRIPESFFARADAALYHAKKDGRNCVKGD